MEPSTAETQKTESAKIDRTATWLSKMAAFCKCNTSVWIGLAILLLGVIGDVLLYALPGQYFVQSELGEYFYGRYQLLNCLHVVSNAAVYLGAFWVGGFMAFRGLRKQ